MKLRHLLRIICFLAVGQFLFACSTGEYYRFSSVKPETYGKPLKTLPAGSVTDVLPPIKEVSGEAEKVTILTKAEPVLEANITTPPKPLLLEKNTQLPLTTKAVAEALNTKTAPALETAGKKIAPLTKAERKEVKKEMKKALRETSAVSSVLLIVLAFLLPPLAVALHEGIGTRFWLSILLTILFWVPGVIYALLVVTDSI